MTWAAQLKESDSLYTMMLTYALKSVGSYDAGMLHAGCGLDMHYFPIKNTKISENNIEYNNSGVTATIRGVQVLEVKDKNGIGSVERWGSNAMLKFENGRLIDAYYYT